MVVVLLGVLFWRSNRAGVWSPSGSVDDKPRETVADAASSVDVPLALVSDYYEHFKEHVPPFQEDGVMQSRERNYRPPQDPFSLLQERLRPDLPQDAALAGQMSEVRERWMRGGPKGEDSLADIENLAAASSLDAQVLLEVGRGSQFLVGDELAADLFRAALTKAAAQFKDTRPGDPSALPLLRLLDQTKALYRVNDQDALARRFELGMRLYPPLSVESRCAACLCAQSLSVGGKPQEAADTILVAWRQDQEVGDLGISNPQDLAEMEWRAGRYLTAAGRYADAIGFYRDFVRGGGDETLKRQAVAVWALCLERSGRPNEAESLRAEYHLLQPAPNPQAATGPTSRNENSR
jgi:hypothetical protein